MATLRILVRNYSYNPAAGSKLYHLNSMERASGNRKVPTFKTQASDHFHHKSMPEAYLDT